MSLGDMSPSEFDDWLTRAIEAKKDARRRKGWMSIDELLERNGTTTTPAGAAVASRIRRLNPQGYWAGERVRGYNPHQRFSRRLDLDVIGPKAFIARFGRDAYRAIPRERLFRSGHRKAIPMSYVAELS